MTLERMLIVRTGGLGDTVLTWPALAAARRRFPAAQIDLLGYRERCQLLVVEGGASLALDVEGSGLHTLFNVCAEPPDTVRARFGSYQTVVAFGAPGDYALAENLSSCGVEEVHAFLPFPSGGEKIHVADHLKRSLTGVDLAAEGADLPLPVSEQERREGREALGALGLEGARIALVAPGSGSVQKNWAPERFAALLADLRREELAPVLLRGPADKDAVAALLHCLGSPTPAVLEDYSLAALKGIMARAALLVGNDSGPTHLAALVGVPTVAVFGPSDADLWGPRGRRVCIVRGQAECAPCPPERMHACPQRACLDAVDVRRVSIACRELLAGGRGGHIEFDRNNPSA